MSPERTSLVRETPSQQGDGAARPRSPQVDVGARPETVTPSGQQERMQNPPDLTYSLFSKPIDRDRYLPARSSRENGVVNAVAGPSCQAPTEGDKPKSLRKRKRTSPKVIPNPVGCSYGMDLAYFCYSSESEEEGEEEHEEQAGTNPPKGISRSPKQAAKRVRFDKSPEDSPSRLRTAASVPGPHGQSQVPVEAGPTTPAPVASSSSRSDSPPPPQALLLEASNAPLRLRLNLRPHSPGLSCAPPHHRSNRQRPVHRVRRLIRLSHPGMRRWRSTTTSPTMHSGCISKSPRGTSVSFRGRAKTVTPTPLALIPWSTGWLGRRGMSGAPWRASSISAGISSVSETPGKFRTVAKRDPFGVISRHPLLSPLCCNRVPNGCS